MGVRDVTDIHEEFDGDRLPPGQRETERFPVLSLNDEPNFDPDDWEFTVTGAVDEALSLS